MEEGLISYLQRLEIMAFFTGYPLVYFIILSLAGKPQTRTETKKRLVSFLPFAYSLIGILFLGLELRNLHPDYSLGHIRSEIENPFLVSWGLLAIFFCLPVLRKKPVISLLHSLVFFYLLLKDLYFQVTSSAAEKSILKNDMSVYADSILLNIAAFSAIVILYFLIKWFRNKTNPSS